MTDPIDWPADLAPYRVAFYLQAHRGGTESPFSRAGKFYALSAPRWVAKLTFRAGYNGVVDAAGFGPRLDALIASLQGIGQVRLWDFRRPSPIQHAYQLAGSSLTHPAASKGATDIVLSGYQAGSLALLPGDYVEIGDGRPHIITASPGVADGSGNLAVSSQPPLRRDVPGGNVGLGQIGAVFRLASDNADDAGQNETEVGMLTEYALTFVEDLTYGA